MITATWEDVSRIALSLPEASEQPLHDLRSWRVRDKLFVWERPLRRSDLRALGEAAPAGPILGARVEHLVAKEALIADDPDVFFTTPHFDGYAAVLVQLERLYTTEVASGPMFYQPRTAASRGIKGILPPVRDTYLWNVWDWTLE